MQSTPFSQDRAREIWAQRGMQNTVSHAMTGSEIAYVKAIWDTLPGNSCFMSAFFLILNGQVDEKRTP